MNHLKFFLLAILALPIIFTSCDKDDDDAPPTPDTTTCKVIKSYIYNDITQAIDDSVIYTYTGALITKLAVPGEAFMTIEYSNNRVTKRSIFDTPTSTVATDYETISYNLDGSVSKIESYESSGSSYTKWRQIGFTYSSGKHNKVTFSEDDGAGNFEVVADYTYTYTGNNITSATANEYMNGTIVDSYVMTYAYDNKANYFTKQNSLFMFTDPYLSDFDGSLFPLMVSANNATGITSTSSSPVALAYQADAKGNITRFDVSGKPLIGYAYLCQ